MLTFAILFWTAGIEGICALWFVRDCPTWGDVWRKIWSPIPRARLLKNPPTAG